MEKHVVLWRKSIKYNGVREKIVKLLIKNAKKVLTNCRKMNIINISINHSFS